MRKFRSYIFLGILTLLFLVLGYCAVGGFSGSGEKVNVKSIIKKVDPMVSHKDPPQFRTAYEYMDSCLNEDPKLLNDKEFEKKYYSLRSIVKILKND
jgi:hypothetical protein